MAYRIDVGFKVTDTRAQAKLDYFKSLNLEGKVASVSLVNSYLIDAKLTNRQVKTVAARLANPLLEKASVDKPLAPRNFDYALEVGFLPGVTDNVANTTKELVEDLVKEKFENGEGFYSSQVVFISGNLTKADLQKIADSLHNPLIQRIRLKTKKQFAKDKGFGTKVPKVKLQAEALVEEINVDVSDAKLAQIGKEGVAGPDGRPRGPLALDLPAMKAIQEHFKNLGRNPTDVEIESLAQTWSEHCKHTIFNSPIDEIEKGLYKTYIKAATEEIRKKKGKKDFCVSVFKDNSGAIIFLDHKHLVTHKVETHNSPSALDPFGGAITGIVGVNRDAMGFGLGAKPVINVYGYCFADPTEKERLLYRDKELTQKMFSPRRIMEGVVQGINAGGNCSGIPTPQGFVFFDDRFQGKPSIFCGTVGLLPKKTGSRKLYEKKAEPGDYIVMTGGRVGLDGIHGATFSSESLNTGSPATAVQIGDPITQKKLSDALIKEARDLNLINSITDNGAGGLSSSVGEMSKEAGGCEVYLEKVPLKYPGLEPWQIWISESQERMTLSVPKNRWEKFSALMQKRGVEATVIGEFKNSGKCQVFYGEKMVMDLEMDFLHEGLPKKHLLTNYVRPINQEPPREILPKNTGQAIVKLLARPNIASFAFITKQYDHEVQGGSVLKPLQGKGEINGQASVTRPLLSSKKAVVLSQGLYPNYSDIDTYHMAAASLDTAIRSNVAAGGNLAHMALLDNFSWCSSNEPERLAQLKAAVRACYDYATVYGAPFISGKDSMFNDFKGFDADGEPVKISIPPTLLVSSISVMADAGKAVSEELKLAGDLVYILGQTHNELGASEFYAMLSEEQDKPYLGNHVPKVDAARNLAVYKSLSQAIEKELVASSISLTRGGLAAALLKTAIGGQLGLDISLKDLPGSVNDNLAALFSESQGRVLVSIAPENQEKFENLFTDLDCRLLGKATDAKNVIIKGLDGKPLAKISLSAATKAYQSTLANY